ncbi:uncharacterized protein LOC131942514 isoform X2 [Physella acuta]|uniref:uncharacterized protein LOC131942514 isoform X2 n=1 Tax=Physella acuta TaxID=109671 RepID=UPI0027DCACDF|nr:uncharacterized protein LOC131942514 isoform X2 [Physella acuta]
MQVAPMLLSLFLVLTEYVQVIILVATTQKYLNENGIIATIDGYRPNCPGCIRFGIDDLYVYGRMHVPKEKLYLMDKGRFYLEICGMKRDGPCSVYKSDWMTFCSFKLQLKVGCENRLMSKYIPCWCNNTIPMQWLAQITHPFFERKDMALRFIFDPAPNPNTFADRAPFEKNNTLFIPDLMERGHIVNVTYSSSRSTSKSRSMSPETHRIHTITSFHYFIK